MGYAGNLDGGGIDPTQAVDCVADASYVYFHNGNGSVIFTGLRSNLQYSFTGTAPTLPNDPNRVPCFRNPPMGIVEQTWIWLLKLIIYQDIKDHWPTGN